MGGTPDAPDIPSAGENFAETIAAQLESQGQLRQLDFLNQLGDVELLRRLGPALANVQLGFQEEFGPQFTAQESEAQRQARLGELQNIADLAPTFNQAVGISDPQTTQIRNTLGQQLQQELGFGAQLDPGLRREIQQGVRQAQTARGVTRGNAPIAEEAFTLGSRGQALRQQRQTNAANFLQTQAATRPDALSFLTGRGGVNVGLPQLPNLGTQQQTQQLFNAGLNQSNLQAQTAFNAAQAGQGGGFAGAAGGALSGAALGSSIFPGVGTAVGALLGGVAGGL